MYLARKRPEHRWEQKARMLRHQIVELKEQLNILPDSHQYERYPHLHKRLEQLINEYMQLLNRPDHWVR